MQPSLATLVAPFLPDITIDLPSCQVWFRARLSYKAAYQRFEPSLRSGQVFRPWTGKDIGAPPPVRAGFGRLNRAGVSVLYLASDGDTALAEIRPHPGHYVSLGGFRSQAAVRLADFDPDIALFSASDERLDLFAIIQAFDRLMSMPVTPDLQTPYLLTQLLAEVLLSLGFDGVRYRSSVAGGSNMCIFRPSLFEFVEDYSEVRHVRGVQFHAPPVRHLMDPTDDDRLLDREA